MPRNIRTLLLALAVIFVVAVLGLTMARSPPRSPLPNPNGYDDFVKAGAAVPGSVVNFQTLDEASLRDLVSTNAESLRLLRVGLARPCLMPMNPALTNLSGWMYPLATMKRLVQLLAAEGRLRELENRPADAARSYTDALRFGNGMSRGGFLITRLIGIACEAIGGRWSGSQHGPVADLVCNCRPPAKVGGGPGTVSCGRAMARGAGAERGDPPGEPIRRHS